MLTKDLIRARLSGDYVKPQFVSPDAPEIARYAGELVLLYADGEGTSAAELDEAPPRSLSRSRTRNLPPGFTRSSATARSFRPPRNATTPPSAPNSSARRPR